MSDEGSLSLPARREVLLRHVSARLLQRIGDLLQRRQDVVRCVQWTLVAVYLFLLLVPALLPQAPAAGGVFAHLPLFAEAMFWGLWWPGVILATLLFGQFWCGLFCPDGTMTEFFSRHGRAGKIPPRLRWSGWPLMAFSIITVAEHLLNAHRSPAATLALLGSGSLAAWVTGHFLGRGKRVWCRYLCPVASMFSLLARCAIFHFRVDRDAWDAVPRPLPRAVDCPTLLDVRRLRSNEKCSMCGRCSGHRNAVALAVHAPGREIAVLRVEDAKLRDAFAICFVLVGLCYGVTYGQGVVLRLWPGSLAGNALTMRLATIGATASAIGATVAALLWLSAAGNARWTAVLAHGLTPLAGLGLFQGALEYAIGIFEQSGIGVIGWSAWLRIPVLLFGGVWTLALGMIRIKELHTTATGRVASAVAYMAAVSFVIACYLFAPRA